MNHWTVERDIWIQAAPERVWQAVTDPVQIGQWWPPDAWAISTLEVGGRVTFGEAPDAAYATIEVLDPLRQLTMHWDSNPLFPVTTMRTTFILNAENGGTRLKVTEARFETLPEDIRQKRFESTAQGYADVLQDLKVFVEQAVL